MHELTHGFTLIELLIALTVAVTIATFSASESISSFQVAIEHLSQQEELLWSEVRTGASLRYRISDSTGTGYE